MKKFRKLKAMDRSLLNILEAHVFKIKTQINTNIEEPMYLMLQRLRHILVWTAHPSNFIRIINNIEENRKTKTIIGSAWFTGQSTIGIVETVNETGDHKAYIGSASGYDEAIDIIHIAEFGTKFPLKEARSIIKSTGLPTIVKY